MCIKQTNDISNKECNLNTIKKLHVSVVVDYSDKCLHTIIAVDKAVTILTTWIRCQHNLQSWFQHRHNYDYADSDGKFGGFSLTLKEKSAQMKNLRGIT